MDGTEKFVSQLLEEAEDAEKDNYDLIKPDFLEDLKKIQDLFLGSKIWNCINGIVLE